MPTICGCHRKEPSIVCDHSRLAENSLIQRFGRKAVHESVELFPAPPHERFGNVEARLCRIRQAGDLLLVIEMHLILDFPLVIERSSYASQWCLIINIDSHAWRPCSELTDKGPSWKF